jgi:hypothetical protein
MVDTTGNAGLLTRLTEPKSRFITIYVRTILMTDYVSTGQNFARCCALNFAWFVVPQKVQ